MQLKLFVNKKYWGFFLTIIVVNIVSNFLLALANLLPTYAFDFLLKGNIAFFNYFFWALIAAFILQGITRYFYQYLMGVYTERFLNDYRFLITNQLQNYSYAQLQTHDATKLHNQLNKDLEIGKTYGFFSFFGAIDLFFIISFSFASFVIINWLLALIVAFLLVLNLLLTKLLGGYINKNAAFFSKANAQHFEKITQLTKGFQNFFFLQKLFRLGKMMDQSATVYCQEYLTYYKKNLFVYFFVGFISVFGQIFFLGLAVTLAFVEISFAPIMLTALLSIGTLSSNIFGTFGVFFRSLVKIKTGAQSLQKNLPTAAENQTANPPLLAVGDFVSLELQNLSFAYEGKPILTNFNYQFLAHKKYLIKGPSGCGKSTLLKIIMGYYDDYEGKILVNDSELKTSNQAGLLGLISYCEANPYIFAANLAANITIFDHTVDSSQMQTGMQIAHVDFVSAEQKDLTTLNLSTGEKQRISLARSFYQPKPIVIFDEALANLNQEIAIQIENHLLNDPNTTFIHVTHHYSDVQLDKYDAIIDLGVDADHA